MKKIFLIFVSFFCSILPVVADNDITQYSKSAILIDQDSGQVLYDFNSEEKLAPASMTKIASMLLIMEAIDSNKISMTDEVTISAEAANMGGSQIFLQEGEIYKVSELLKGVAIASGNDAVVALAEKVAGTTSNFVIMMNDKCKELGCVNTNFVNPHGLDDENHYSTAYDMALLAKELLIYETILDYTSIYEEYLTRNDGTKTWLVNTNKLVRFYPGVDGLKTGYTDNAGYCLTATALKNDLRLISVVMGVSSSDERSTDTVNLLNYGFNTYKNVLIREKENSLGKVDVVGGKIESIDVYLEDDATELLKITDEFKEYNFDIKIDNIVAPMDKNSVVGEVDILSKDGKLVDTVNIVIKEDIKKANLIDYLIRNLKLVVGGK